MEINPSERLANVSEWQPAGDLGFGTAVATPRRKVGLPRAPIPATQRPRQCWPVGEAAGERTVAALASAAARLLRAYATQVEALRRLRNGGSQFVRVEHVHVNEGGQAVIGNVSSER